MWYELRRHATPTWLIGVTSFTLSGLLTMVGIPIADTILLVVGWLSTLIYIYTTTTTMEKTINGRI